MVLLSVKTWILVSINHNDTLLILESCLQPKTKLLQSNNPASHFATLTNWICWDFIMKRGRKLSKTLSSEKCSKSILLMIASIRVFMEMIVGICNTLKRGENFCWFLGKLKIFYESFFGKVKIWSWNFVVLKSKFNFNSIFHYKIILIRVLNLWIHKIIYSKIFIGFIKMKFNNHRIMTIIEVIINRFNVNSLWNENCYWYFGFNYCI